MKRFLIWFLIVDAVLLVVAAIGFFVVSSQFDGEWTAGIVEDALGLQITVDAGETGGNLKPLQHRLTGVVVGPAGAPVLTAESIDIGLGWSSLIGPARVTSLAVNGASLDPSSLAAAEISEDGDDRIFALLSRFSYTGEVRFPGDVVVTEVMLDGAARPSGLELSGTASVGAAPLNIALNLKDPGPTLAARGGRLDVTVTDPARPEEQRITLSGGWERQPRASFRGAVSANLAAPMSWLDLLRLPAPMGLAGLSDVSARGLLYLDASVLSVESLAWTTPAREGVATLGIDTLEGVTSLTGRVSVNRFELTDLLGLIDARNLEPADGLGALATEVELSVDRLGIGALQADEVTMSIAGDGAGSLSVGTDMMSVLGGSLRLQMSANLSEPVARLAGSTQIAHLPLAPLIVNLDLPQVPVDGTLDASILLSSQGEDWQDLIASLAGSGFIRVHGGNFAPTEGEPLRVEEFGGSVEIERGRIALNPMRLTTGETIFEGPANVVLPAGTLLGALNAEDGDARVLIRGTLQSPEIVVTLP